MTVSKVLERKDVPQESKWNDKALFASWDAWQTEAAALKSTLPQLTAFDGKLDQGPTVLAGWLALVTGVDRRLMRLWSYAYMANAVDANDTTAKENLGQLMGLYARFKAASALSLIHI